MGDSSFALDDRSFEETLKARGVTMRKLARSADDAGLPLPAGAEAFLRGESARLDKMFPQSIEVRMMSGDAGGFWCIGESIEVPETERRRPREEGQEDGPQEMESVSAG